MGLESVIIVGLGLLVSINFILAYILLSKKLFYWRDPQTHQNRHFEIDVINFCFQIGELFIK